MSQSNLSVRLSARQQPTDPLLLALRRWRLNLTVPVERRLRIALDLLSNEERYRLCGSPPPEMGAREADALIAGRMDDLCRRYLVSAERDAASPAMAHANCRCACSPDCDAEAGPEWPSRTSPLWDRWPEEMRRLQQGHYRNMLLRSPVFERERVGEERLRAEADEVERRTGRRPTHLRDDDGTVRRAPPRVAEAGIASHADTMRRMGRENASASRDYEERFRLACAVNDSILGEMARGRLSERRVVDDLHLTSTLTRDAVRSIVRGRRLEFERNRYAAQAHSPPLAIDPAADLGDVTAWALHESRARRQPPAPEVSPEPAPRLSAADAEKGRARARARAREAIAAVRDGRPIENTPRDSEPEPPPLPPAPKGSVSLRRGHENGAPALARRNPNLGSYRPE